MTHDDFEQLLLGRISKIRKTLGQKAAEYAVGGDRLHNFKAAAELRADKPSGVLLGMLVKHWVSIQDMVDRFDIEGRGAPDAMIDEKIGDAINYLILLEAVLKE